jgi:hypothetical protein
MARAAAVLDAEFPALAKTVRIRTPDEKSKRHGQATAAASLPALRTAGERGSVARRAEGGTV